MKVLLILIELFIISFLILRLSKLFKSYKKNNNDENFPTKLQIVLMETLPKHIALIVSREITMLYYLFTRKTRKEEGMAFSYHKEIGYNGVLFALIGVILIESVGLFFLLHAWIPVLSWVHLALNGYGLLYLVSDYRAIVKLPIILTEHDLFIRVGSRRQIKIPYERIASINGGDRFLDQKKEKGIFKAILIEFDTPQFELNLKEPVTTTNLIGKPQEIMKVYITVDDKERFRQTLHQRLASSQHANANEEIQEM
ncbi:hypothetical protein M3181_20070 [Mesobacillus maritimus]|uniref:hypothetical protein n=1 Tax=Mesobacillus maritimus TaxID=1643336 RepID=UPI00203DDA77|nr:hypothetical protein [Mesobacillus maritimus]MCM3671259.1 hypothetical protein [Mesobacillus maritimus]